MQVSDDRFQAESGWNCFRIDDGSLPSNVIKTKGKGIKTFWRRELYFIGSEQGYKRPKKLNKLTP
jgi:hypothetical protein